MADIEEHRCPECDEPLVFQEGCLIAPPAVSPAAARTIRTGGRRDAPVALRGGPAGGPFFAACRRRQKRMPPQRPHPQPHVPGSMRPPPAPASGAPLRPPFDRSPRPAFRDGIPSLTELP